MDGEVDDAEGRIEILQAKFRNVAADRYERQLLRGSMRHSSTSILRVKRSVCLCVSPFVSE